MKWWQVLLFNTTSYVEEYSFVCAVKWFQVLNAMLIFQFRPAVEEFQVLLFKSYTNETVYTITVPSRHSYLLDPFATMLW